MPTVSNTHRPASPVSNNTQTTGTTPNTSQSGPQSNAGTGHSGASGFSRGTTTNQVPDAPQALSQDFPPEIIQTGTLRERMDLFVTKWPNNAKIVKDVPYEWKTEHGSTTTKRTVLAISTKGMRDEDVTAIMQSYVEHTAHNSVSFPLSTGAMAHLRTRVGKSLFDFTFGDSISPGVYAGELKRKPYDWRKFLWGQHNVTEALIELSPGQMSNLRSYVGLTKKQSTVTLGNFTAKVGPSNTRSTLADNTPTVEGESHNCTSWIAMAPIGEKRSDGTREQLREIAGVPSGWGVYDNPGYWSMFLQAKSTSKNCNTTVFWAPKRGLEEFEDGQKLGFDFDCK